MSQFHSPLLWSVFNSYLLIRNYSHCILKNVLPVSFLFLFLLVLWESILCVLIILTPQLLPDPPIFPSPLNFVYSFLKRPSSTACVTYILVDVQPSSDAWLTTKDYTVQENWPLLFLKLSTAHSSSARARTWCLLPHPMVGLFGFEFHRTCASCHNLCHNYLLCPKNTVLVINCLWLLQSFNPLFWNDR